MNLGQETLHGEKVLNQSLECKRSKSRFEFPERSQSGIIDFLFLLIRRGTTGIVDTLSSKPPMVMKSGKT